MSARKCWKCSLLGVIFATGVSSFREMASAGQAKPTYTLSLLHNRIYVTSKTNFEPATRGSVRRASGLVLADDPEVGSRIRKNWCPLRDIAGHSLSLVTPSGSR